MTMMTIMMTIMMMMKVMIVMVMMMVMVIVHLSIERKICVTVHSSYVYSNLPALEAQSTWQHSERMTSESFG